MINCPIILSYRLKLTSLLRFIQTQRSGNNNNNNNNLLRCSPSKDHPALALFDNQLKSAICQITNSNLSDVQWLQASLPVREGGLGVRRVASLALPAFLASAASTQSLQATILANCSGNIPEYTFLEAYLSDWSALFGAPPDQLPHKQSVWDRPGVASDRTQVQSCLDSPYRVASFLAASARHSGDWLFPLPIASYGLKLFLTTMQ